MDAVRLLVFGTRGAWGRLAGIAVGIATGVTLALLLIAGASALESRDARAAWTTPATTTVDERTPTSVLIAQDRDVFRGERIQRVDLAVPAGAVPAPPAGLPIPASGEYVASPALAHLIDIAPADELGDRYGTAVGVIPDTLLSSPDSLVVVVGSTTEALATHPSAAVVESFAPSAFGGNSNYQTLALVGGVALLIPAFLLVSVATGLGAAARAERWQTLLTIGASRRFVDRVALTEATGTAVVGAAIGVALFFAVRPLLAFLPVAGLRLVPGDLTVAPVPLAVVLVVVVGGSAISAALGARRARTSASARVVFEARPRPTRLIPLIVGIALFLVIERFGAAMPVPLIFAIVPGFIAVAVGLLIAGPYLTWIAGCIARRFGSTAPAVVGAGRIVRAPRASFRSVAGLVAATFLISVFAFGTTAHVGAEAFTDEPLMPANAVGIDADLARGMPEADARATLERVPGITDVVFAHTDDAGVYVAAADVAALGSATPSTPVVELTGGLFSAAPGRPAFVPASVTDLAAMRVSGVIVTTDGTAAAIERARTALLSLDGVDPTMGASTRAEAVSMADSDLATQFAQIGRLAVVIVTALAAAVLTTSMIAALYDRRQTFAVLDLIGMPRDTLRRVLTVETVVPLVGIVVPAAALGWFTAWLLITSLSERTLGRPDSLLVVSLTATAVMAAGAVFIAARAGAKITRSADNTRNE